MVSTDQPRTEQEDTDKSVTDQAIASPPAESTFLFCCCQVGAESALKAEIAKNHPGLRFAFSRPGFLTFKIVDDAEILSGGSLRSYFARTFGFCGGRVEGETDEQRANEAAKLIPKNPFRHVHIWNRDSRAPGDRGFEPFLSDELIARGEPIAKRLRDRKLDIVVNRAAKSGDWIADCIVVDDETWWIGWHQAQSVATRWPGGVPLLKMRDDVVSRAYWKMQEALKWSQLPIAKGDRCVELGSSPGGASQALLERELKVIGIDPAQMNDQVTSHPNFTHIRAKAAAVKRREFSDIPWLMADANVAPKYTLDAIEDIVTNDRVNVRGMLITLKLADWKLATELDEHLSRIRSWGFRHIKTRQLAFNRREVCVFAMRRKHLLRK